MKENPSFQLDHSDMITAMSIEYPRLAVGCRDGSIHVWDQKKLLHEIKVGAHRKIGLDFCC